jgi:membrane fusion protein (multidrug efflux system)
MKSGMIVEVTVPGRTMEDVIVVPLATIIPEKGEHAAYVAVGGRAERRLVKIDSILGTEAVILSGLSQGDKLIVEGHRALQDGSLLALPDEKIGLEE